MEPSLRSRKRGLLIAIEGIDGAGKTSVAKSLVEILKKKLQIRSVYMKEPSYSLFGKLLRKLSQRSTLHRGFNKYLLALLSTADRYFNQIKILAEIYRGSIIIYDRYLVSGLAYHGADGVNKIVYLLLNMLVKKPDYIIYLHVTPETACKRKKMLSDMWEKMLDRVYTEYKKTLNMLRRIYNVHVVTIDTEDANLDDIILRIANYLMKILNGE